MTTRDELIERYRKLRQISASHNTAAMAYAAGPAVLDRARRLGLGNRRFTFDMTDEEDTLVSDLVVYAAVEGRSRAIDRYAKAAALDPASDEGRTLAAMRQARFSVWQVRRRHETAGLILLDTARETETWLMDLNFEASAPLGASFAGRLFELDGFAMSCGAIVPLDSEMLEDALMSLPVTGAGPDALMEDIRTASAIYRAAITEGLMGQVRFRPAGGAPSTPPP